MSIIALSLYVHFHFTFTFTLRSLSLYVHFGFDEDDDGLPPLSANVVDTDRASQPRACCALLARSNVDFILFSILSTSLLFQCNNAKKQAKQVVLQFLFLTILFN